jgi:Uma2 family endonuclease
MGIFRAYLKGKICRVYDGLSVILDEENTFIPDLFILCDRSKKKANGIHGAPDLVVEVLSPKTAKNDITDKKDQYEKHGVKEYWIINPKEHSILVYWHTGEKFEVSNVYTYLKPEEKADWPEEDLKDLLQEFKASLFDDLIVNLEDVFENVD